MTNTPSFSQTSDKPYDRHHYKVVFRGEIKTIYCESWEAAQSIWFQWAGMDAIDRIEVCDFKKVKPKGF